jgi:hypothetical protein
MENNHQVASNSARQIRTSEHYKFENACQFSYSAGMHLNDLNRQKHGRQPFFSRNLGVVATGQAGDGGELFVLR